MPPLKKVGQTPPPPYDPGAARALQEGVPSQPLQSTQHDLASTSPPRPLSSGPEASAVGQTRGRVSIDDQKKDGDDAIKHYAWIELLDQKDRLVNKTAQIWDNLYKSNVLGCELSSFIGYGRPGRPVLKALLEFEAANPIPNSIDWVAVTLANANSDVAKLKASRLPGGKPKKFRYPVKRLLSDLIKTKQTALETQAASQSLFGSLGTISALPALEASQEGKLAENYSLAFMQWLVRYDVVAIDDDNMKSLFQKLKDAGVVAAKYETFRGYLLPKKFPTTDLMAVIRNNDQPKSIDFDALKIGYADAKAEREREAQNTRKRTAPRGARASRKKGKPDQTTQALTLPSTTAKQKMAQPLWPMSPAVQSTSRLASPGSPTAQAIAQAVSPGSPEMDPNMFGALQPTGSSFGDERFWESVNAPSPTLVSESPPASPNPFQLDPAPLGYGTNPFDGWRASSPPQLPWTRPARRAPSRGDNGDDENDHADLYAPRTPPRGSGS